MQVFEIMVASPKDLIVRKYMYFKTRSLWLFCKMCLILFEMVINLFKTPWYSPLCFFWIVKVEISEKGVLKSHGIYRSKIGPNFFNLTMITRPWIPKHWIFVQDKAFPPYFMRIYKKYSWSHYISIKTRWIWCWIAKITCTRKVIKICENQRNFKILTLKFCWSLPEKTINILMSLGYHPEQA